MKQHFLIFILCYLVFYVNRRVKLNDGNLFTLTTVRFLERATTKISGDVYTPYFRHSYWNVARRLMRLMPSNQLLQYKSA
jgi:hypothetical protein